MLGMTEVVEELDPIRGLGVETSATGSREHPWFMPRYPAPCGCPMLALATPTTAANSSPRIPFPANRVLWGFSRADRLGLLPGGSFLPQGFSIFTNFKSNDCSS